MNKCMFVSRRYFTYIAKDFLLSVDNVGLFVAVILESVFPVYGQRNYLFMKRVHEWARVG